MSQPIDAARVASTVPHPTRHIPGERGVRVSIGKSEVVVLPGATPEALSLRCFCLDSEARPVTWDTLRAEVDTYAGHRCEPWPG